MSVYIVMVGKYDSFAGVFKTRTEASKYATDSRYEAYSIIERRV